ncbi:hypothetical protein BFP97_01160 [Roseivirga sp. 4D4]|uniref:DUF6010 family protein n=1 Tax=Roseivirga sp. 4D4 TaxID=1889784 RepID=UPI00085332EA|nr:DUF6010 family protein [Roseivirga sp. 4D4]OEK00203.1 hypothetical protein BFP97_01160 [Roseivirga sp. 4D4]
MMKPVAKNILVGLLLATVTIALHMSLSESRRLELTSFLLVLIGSVYYGFALLSKHKEVIVIEVIVASVFVAMGVFGLWFSPWILITGLFLHGLWDIAHHNASVKLAKIPSWYIPFCAAYDWTMAIYVSLIMLN